MEQNAPELPVVKPIDMQNQYGLYILMRTDLSSMNGGRAMAQASHASNAFIHKYSAEAAVVQWQNETKQGFGTAIVLGATIAQIFDVFNNRLASKATSKYWLYDLVTDPDYVVRVPKEIYGLIDPKKINKQNCYPIEGTSDMSVSRRETTCGYVFGIREHLKPALEHLVLHP